MVLLRARVTNSCLAHCATGSWAQVVIPVLCLPGTPAPLEPGGMLPKGTTLAGRSKALRYCRKSQSWSTHSSGSSCSLHHPASGFLDCHLILFVKHPLSYWSTAGIHSFINNIVEIVFVLTGPAFPQRMHILWRCRLNFKPSVCYLGWVWSRI